MKSDGIGNWPKSFLNSTEYSREYPRGFSREYSRDYWLEYKRELVLEIFFVRLQSLF